MRRLIGWALLAACSSEPAAVPLSADPDCAPWSDPDTWPSGRVPGVGDAAGDCAAIEPDRCVVLDTDVSLTHLHIEGTLRFDDTKNLTLRSDRVVVDGVLEVGTATAPFEHHARIELSADATWPLQVEDPLSGGEVDWVWAAKCSDGFDLGAPKLPPRSLRVGSGATLDLHGTLNGPTWTRLSRSAGPSEADPHLLELEEEVGWLPGDHIVVPSTSFEASETESHVVDRVEGVRIWTQDPLAHPHVAFDVRSELDPSDGQGVEVRGEVGHLSRNIVVAGVDLEVSELDGDCAGDPEPDCGWVACRIPADLPEELAFEGAEILVEATEHGGPTPTVRIDGVEVTGGGKYGQLGHYPIHFHEVEHLDGSFVRRSSVHGSANRAIVLHGTGDLLVEDNVVYDVIGHAYYLEPSTHGHRTHLNRLVGNLGVRARSCNPLDGRNSPGPGVFFGRDPENQWVGNVAAASDYTGFYLDTRQESPCTTYGEGGEEGCDCRFEGNTAHSSWSGLWSEETTTRTINLVNFTAFRIRGRGIWMHNRGVTRVTGYRAADVAIGTYFAFQSFRTVDAEAIIADSLFVGTTGEPDPRGALGLPRIGVELYEGRIRVEDTTFADYPPLLADGVPGGAIGRNQRLYFYDNDPVNHTEGLRLVDANPVYFGPPEPDSAGTATVAVYDVDGSLTGQADSWVVGWHDVFAGATPQVDWGASHLLREDGEVVQFVVDWVDPTLDAGPAPTQVHSMDTEVLDEAGRVISGIPGALAVDVRNKQGVNVLAGGTYRVRFRDRSGEDLPGFDAFAVVLRSGSAGAAITVAVPVVDPAWAGTVHMATSLESDAPRTPLRWVATRDELDVGTYWVDPEGPHVVVHPSLGGQGGPLEGELVVLHAAP